MKRFVFFFITVCTFTMAFAQQLTVRTVKLRPQDARARTNPREDAKGKKCAIIRVGVVGVEDLAFPDAVGKVERSLSEYVVYVPEGLKSLKYTKAGANLGEVIFDDWDMEINSLASYDVIFESDSHLRSALFSIHPKNASLVFNGEKVNLDEEGMAIINKPIGDYSYRVTADGFEGQTGTISLIEDDISTVTNVVLQEILYPVTINVFPEDATVFVDNVPYLKDAWADLQLSGGKHSFRVTASNYEDEERTIDVKNGLSPIYFTLKENEIEVIEHKEERTRTSINIRNAFYLTGGIDINGLKDLSKLTEGKMKVDWKAELSYIFHFAGYWGVRVGIGLGSFKPKDFELETDSACQAFEVPLQLAISIPFGAYNRHMFTILGGGYGKYIYNGAEKDEDYYDYSDYGLRLDAILDIGHFTLGVSLSKSLREMKLSAGINMGFKLYSLKKKKKKQ